MKIFMNWSGGKDSALALYKAQQDALPVEALVTSVSSATDRISMHGVRRELLEQQAASIGLPLYTIDLPEMPGMDIYEQTVHRTHRQLKEQEFTHGIFGDIFLQDLKAYRKSLLAKDGLQCLFPIWKSNSQELMKEFISLKFKAIVVCVNSAFLDQSFCGRMLDDTFVNDLPAGVDICGENGEYHSFVFDGPLFSTPVSFGKGDIIFKEYASPKNDDCFIAPQAYSGFYFQDLIIT